MADTTILLNGFSLLNGANINPNPNDGNLGEGSVSISSGTMIFEPDDIIVFEVTGAGPNGEIESGAEITRILVYDNATDYFNNTVKYTYEGNNANKTGTVSNNPHMTGDRFLRINANKLVSSDPGAPDLSHLFISPGTDLSDAASGGSITIDQFQDTDYDGNSTIDGGTLEVGDGVFHGGDDFNNSLIVLCFARGTLIETPEGPRYIDTLKIGDLVNTLDNGPQPIRWVSSQKMSGFGLSAPVRIRAGALGNIRDLWVSQNHRMLVRNPATQFLFAEQEVLVAAKYLVDSTKITVTPQNGIEYFHILFDEHQVIFAEGSPSESLFPGAEADRSLDETERDEILQFCPSLISSQNKGHSARRTLRKYEAEVLLCA